MNKDEMDAALERFFEDLRAKQQEMPPEIKADILDSLWELYGD